MSTDAMSTQATSSDTATRSSFPLHSVASAPEAARGRLEAARASFGFLPAPLAHMAESPELLDGFFAANDIFNRCSLGPVEREVVIMTIATTVECHYCVAMHSAMLVRGGAATELIAGLRGASRLDDARLEAIRVFTRSVMAGHGAVADADLQAFLEAGHTLRAALDVVLGLGTYTLTTAANRLTRAAVDAPFAPFAWPAR